MSAKPQAVARKRPKPQTAARKRPKTQAVPRKPKPEPSDTLGMLVMRARRAAELTQYGLSRASGVSITTISAIENDHFLPRRATLVLLCDALPTLIFADVVQFLT
jgi:DNA-binding XRE family transcriptional regulator